MRASAVWTKGVNDKFKIANILIIVSAAAIWPRILGHHYMIRMMSEFIEQLGDGHTIWLGGLLIGLLFGISGQQSQFCLRAACLEFWRGIPGAKLAIWLFAFSAALIATQAQLSAGSLDPADFRQITGTGSMSGAILGGGL